MLFSSRRWTFSCFVGSKITTQVKIELPDESKDVEKMIVDDNKDNPNESLAEEVSIVHNSTLYTFFSKHFVVA